MCRLAAYQGPAIPIENIVVLPQHSLLEQSQSATEAKLAVNGDGFGIAWYGDDKRPGLYRDILPAWSDGNLTSICRMVKSRLFLAHVRASTTGETSRVNCHPFTYGKWSFMHNGQVPNIGAIRRHVETMLPDDLYYARRGTTDSELIFLLLLANGLVDDPVAASEKAIKICEAALEGTTQPNKFACVFSNGSEIFGFWHSSNKLSPTLYTSSKLDNGGLALASEPLDGQGDSWSNVPEDSFVTLKDDSIHIEKFVR